MFLKHLRFAFEETSAEAALWEDVGFSSFDRAVCELVFPCITGPLADDILFLYEYFWVFSLAEFQ